MATPPFDEEQAHKWFAIELNNQAWEKLEAGSLSGDAAERLIHAAHASCYHWMQVGTVANHARAECLVGNVYAALGYGEAALRHARRCLELIESHPDQMEDWDHAFAHDCLARATAAAGQTDEAASLKERAVQYGEKIADPEDKNVFDQWLAAGNWHGVV